MFSRLKNLKKQLLSKLEAVESRIHQSDTFNTFKEKIQALPAGKQKALKYASLALLLIGMFSIPFAYFYSSVEYLSEFKEKESLSLKLLKTGSQHFSLPIQKSGEQVKQILESIVKKYQTEGYLISDKGSFKMKEGDLESHRMDVFVKHLNIKQAVALGENVNSVQFIRIHKLEMTENTTYTNHYDMNFSILFFPPSMPRSPKGRNIQPRRKTESKSAR